MVPNYLIRILKPKYYVLTLKLSKKERLIRNIMMEYLAYQMSYNDFYGVCHPIKIKIHNIINFIIKNIKNINIKKFLDKFIDTLFGKISLVLIILFIVFFLFKPPIKQLPQIIIKTTIQLFHIDKIIDINNTTHSSAHEAGKT